MQTALRYPHSPNLPHRYTVTVTCIMLSPCHSDGVACAGHHPHYTTHPLPLAPMPTLINPLTLTHAHPHTHSHTLVYTHTLALAVTFTSHRRSNTLAPATCTHNLMCLPFLGRRMPVFSLTTMQSVIPTGSLMLDRALGVGGLPRGRITEVYGPESSGKTTLALHVVAEAQKLGGACTFIDAEHALDPVYCKGCV